MENSVRACTIQRETFTNKKNPNFHGALKTTLKANNDDSMLAHSLVVDASRSQLGNGLEDVPLLIVGVLPIRHPLCQQ